MYGNSPSPSLTKVTLRMSRHRNTIVCCASIASFESEGLFEHTFQKIFIKFIIIIAYMNIIHYLFYKSNSVIQLCLKL